MSHAAQLRSNLSYEAPTRLGVTVGDDLTDSEPMSADVLADELSLRSGSEWLVEAVVEACVNGDLLFLQRQVERHVPGWVRP